MTTTKKTAKKKAAKETTSQVVITPPNLQYLEVPIIGTAPYVQLSFSQKAIEAMREKMEAGSQAKKGKAKPPRDFDEDFRQAQHRSTEGWNGIPASAFRNAMISACRLVGFKMTIGKLSLFTIGDGLDAVESIPLVKLKGNPEPLIMHVRNATGVCDLRVRAKFWPWSADLKVEYDGDQFSQSDVCNLLARVGKQVGIGEGRPDSKASAGMGWGTFKLG